MKIAIIGTGYVGLVTGTCLAEIGHDVTCVDIDEAKIARLEKGDIPIYEPGLSELVKKNRQSERLHFTTQLTKLGNPEVIFFALPTPPNGDGEADLSFVLGAAKDVGQVIKNYTVFVNKSTVPVGTAKKVHDIIGRETSVAFDVVSNPEFLREGYAVSDFLNPDRIVIGTSSGRAQKVMEELYQPFMSAGVPFLVMDEASSEMAKYAANSFLAAKITFMNEVANVCELVGANVDNVKHAIGLDQRIGTRFLDPGIGYGGSCFPKDVLALEKTAARHGYEFKLLHAVMTVNERQKILLAEKVMNRFGEDLSGLTIAVWGLAFKPDTDDIRETPSLYIIRELLRAGAKVRAYDPEAMSNVQKVLGDSIAYAENAIDAITGADILLVATAWKEFGSVDPDVIAKKLTKKIVFDGRNIFEPHAMISAGLTYVSIGREVIELA